MKFLTTLFASLILVCGVQAQKLKQTGDLTALKGQSEVNVEFVYADDMVVGKKSEAQYIEESMADREAKTPGDGERWLEGWTGAREKHYHPNFINLLNKTVSGPTFGKFPNASLTLRFVITRIEPGFHVGVMKKDSEIDGVAYLTETESEKVLGEVSITRAPGRTYGGADFAVEQRVKESFAVSGKRLGAWFNKKALK